MSRTDKLWSCRGKIAFEQPLPIGAFSLEAAAFCMGGPEPEVTEPGRSGDGISAVSTFQYE